jgi:hypothetical protein
MYFIWETFGLNLVGKLIELKKLWTISFIYDLIIFAPKYLEVSCFCMEWGMGRGRSEIGFVLSNEFKWKRLTNCGGGG